MDSRENGALATTRDVVAAFAARLDGREWDALAELLVADLVYEMPQSRERISGRDRYIAFNAEYPGEWHVVPQLIIADASNACLLFRWVTPDADELAVALFELDGRAITKITDFFPAPFPPPPGREHLTIASDDGAGENSSGREGDVR
jgi:hypothetical protein